MAGRGPVASPDSTPTRPGDVGDDAAAVARGRESWPANEVSGQCGRRTTSGAAGRARRKGDAQTKGGGSARDEQVREDSRASRVHALMGGRTVQTHIGRSASRVRRIRRSAG
jgi:hypothetical protein